MLQSSSQPLLRGIGDGFTEELWGKRGGGQTVAARFGSQLRDLITTLDTTGLSFVRCIKPNAELQPDKFEMNLVLHQLR